MQHRPRIQGYTLRRGGFVLNGQGLSLKVGLVNGCSHPDLLEDGPSY
jgi:hypothetical protein